MADTIYYTRHDGGLTLMKNGKQSTVSNTHPNFDKILVALKARRYAEADTLMSIPRAINAAGISKKNPGKKVFVRNGEVFFEDTRNRKEIKLNGALVDRILRDLGKPGCEKFADALIALLENISKNPLKDVAAELYEWLASGKAPITSDGCILAYKKVRSDYLDAHSRTFDNSPGKICRMKQADVDTDRRNECSRGLHFCSLGYLSSYGAGNSSRVMIVKVNPRHIFAIPRDYSCQKGRASEYYVVGEYLSDSKETKEAFNDSFIDEDNMKTAAPEVKYTKSGLRPSLESLAESYNLCKNGKVKVFTNSNAERSVADWDDDGLETVMMSIETKSVRELVKAAVAKLQKKRK